MQGVGQVRTRKLDYHSPCSGFNVRALPQNGLFYKNSGSQVRFVFVADICSAISPHFMPFCHSYGHLFRYQPHRPLFRCLFGQIADSMSARSIRMGFFIKITDLMSVSFLLRTSVPLFRPFYAFLPFLRTSVPLFRPIKKGHFRWNVCSYEMAFSFCYITDCLKQDLFDLLFSWLVCGKASRVPVCRSQ